MRRALLALGGNQGDVPATLARALRALDAAGVKVGATSRLYDTEPAHVADQPRFLNAAVAVSTSLDPAALLDVVKKVEAAAGRDVSAAAAAASRYGPRPLDVDVIALDGAAGDYVSRDSGRAVTLPHARWRERRFVTAPLADLARGRLRENAASAGPASDVDAILTAALAAEDEAAAADARAALVAACAGAPAASPSHDAIHPVIPLPRAGRWRVGAPGDVAVMAVLNVTPDSFSDGGKLVDQRATTTPITDVDAVLAAALAAVRAGATLLDVGGQSTRPGAAAVTADEEAERVVPAIRALASHPALATIPISVDTFYASVADAALEAGADIVNDVSCGGDANLAKIAADHGAAYVLMHSRGTPATMSQLTDYPAGVVAGVAAEIEAAAARITVSAAPSLLPHWSLLLDPGLGFAKTGAQNVALLANLPAWRARLSPPLASLPLLLGPSRKRFLGTIAGRAAATDRDVATAGAVALAAAGGAAVVRVHSVGATRDAAAVGAAAWAAGQKGGE